MSMPHPSNSKTVQCNAQFKAMLKSAHEQGNGDPLVLKGPIIALDPGETTGVAIYEPSITDWEIRITLHQIPTKSIREGYYELRNLLPTTAPHLPLSYVVEDYRVYGWKADQHKWAGLHTPKWIGAIELMTIQGKNPVFYHSAQMAKTWSTDEKLKLWGIYEAGMKHARDAERHLIRHLFFGKLNSPG